MLAHKWALLFTLGYSLCSATPLPAKQQAKHLRAILHQADEAYFNQNKSIMGDAAYEALRSQYNQLIELYPELATPTAVGGPVAETSGRVAHSRPILSLQKAYTDTTVQSFIEKCGTNLLYTIEPKIDGLTVVLHYQNGLLSQATTRGDGTSGINITAAILASRAAPHTLPNAPAQLEVRGEAFIPFSAFEALNQRRIETGKTPLKSPRNTAAGTLRLHDYAEIARRGLTIQLFELVATNPMPSSHTKALALLNRLGLPTVESHTVPSIEVLDTIAQLNQKRPDLPFATDGIVIRVDNRSAYEQLDKTAHHPRGALARKYRATAVETRLLRIEWAIGKHGKITPVAHFEPIEIQGATLQRASLHNLDHIRAMDLKIGDWIQVIRAGGTIPEIIGNCPARRTGNETPISAP